MNQFKYTPDDVEILVSAMGKEIMEQRRERIQKLMKDAYKSYTLGLWRNEFIKTV